MRLHTYIVFDLWLLSFYMRRNLVKNLVLGYIHASDRKKPEVVQLIHKILDFSPEELEMAMSSDKGGGGGGGGWLSGLWGRRQQPTTPKTPPPDKVMTNMMIIDANH